MRAKVIELPLAPGALSDDTDLAASLRDITMDKTRWRGNRAETIKGWTAFNASGMSAGKARGGHTWATLTGVPVAMACSESAINAWISGTRLDITPKLVDTYIASSGVTFSNNLISITWTPYVVADGTSAVARHYLQVGDVVTLANVAFTTGGGYDPNGSFTVASVPSPTTLTLTASGTAPTKRGPAAYVVTVPFRSGLATGTGDAVAQKTRIYSVDNFGEDAVFCGSDGTPIWHFQRSTSYAELITNGTFTGSATGWTVNGWTYSSNTVTKTSASGGGDGITQDMGNVLTPGKVYEMAFTLSSMGTNVVLSIKVGGVKIHPDISTGSNGSTFNRTYTFRFICPAGPGNLEFDRTDSEVAATSTLDTVSIKLLNIARQIAEAPQINRALFVDGSNHILHALGSVEADGDFNPMLNRWCAQDNFRDWIPDTDNLAGELLLSSGSTAICGRPLGSLLLVLTDDAAYASVFTTSGYSLQLLGQGCGALGAQSIATHNNIAVWAGLTGLRIFDGARVLNLECPVKDQYVNKLRLYQENKTFCWNNVEYGEFWTHYAHTTDGTETSRYIVYNYLEQGNPWSFGTFDRTMWLRAGIFMSPIAIDANGAIWNQETGNTMSGSITLPYVETGYVTAQQGDRWMGCRRYYPDIEQQTGDITWTMTSKRRPQGTSDTQTITKTLTTSTSKADFLLSGRQFKFKWASAASPTQWRLGVVGLEMMTDGARR